VFVPEQKEKDGKIQLREHRGNTGLPSSQWPLATMLSQSITVPLCYRLCMFGCRVFSAVSPSSWNSLLDCFHHSTVSSDRNYLFKLHNYYFQVSKHTKCSGTTVNRNGAFQVNDVTSGLRSLISSLKHTQVTK